MRLIVYILLISSILATGCSSYNKMLKSNDAQAKLDYAIKLYDKGDYFKALPLFEELIAVYRGTQLAQKTYYYFAYCNYKTGDFNSAAYDFDNFVKTFPNSEYTEECAFMQAYCYYEDSPQYSLDQTNTYKAINQLQLFADRYPSSARVEECNRLIDQLLNKLERKAYENAMLYYNMDDFKAAVTCYKNLMNDFPSTPHREEVLFLTFKAQFRLAENSIEEKKIPRYNESVTYYNEFAGAYPESKFRKEADDLYAEVRKRLSNNTGSYFQATTK